MFTRDGGLRRERDVEEEVRTAKGPVTEDRGCARQGAEEGECGAGTHR